MDAIQRARIYKAIDFARHKHEGQLDDCNEDYFTAHVLPVGRGVTAIVPHDTELIQAAFLHDTIEDTDTTYEEVVKEFGTDVADLVMEVTHEGKKDQQGYYFPRLKTPRGILLKMIDRASNLSRMSNWHEKRIAQYLRKSKFWRSEIPHI